MTQPLVRSKKIWITGLISVAVIIGVFFVTRQATNSPIQQAGSSKQTTSSSSPILMQLTSRGGMCEKGACAHETYSIHLDGTYDDHTSLSQADVARLRELIAKLEGASHKSEDAFCQSYVDGSDSIWIFPDYGQVVPCEIKNSANEPIIKDIEGIVYRQ